MRWIYALAISWLCLLFVGCSAHPLPEDVTRSTTVEIVQRIRCEAKQAILRHARERVFDLFGWLTHRPIYSPNAWICTS